MVILRECDGENWFSKGWIDRIMACVKSVSFSTMWNGSLYGLLKPSRGLGMDVLSAYLFIICSVVLSLHIKFYQDMKKIQRLELGREGP